MELKDTRGISSLNYIYKYVNIHNTAMDCRLLQECWHKNPDCRPTFEEIIAKLETILEDLKGGKGLECCCNCIIL